MIYCFKIFSLIDVGVYLFIFGAYLKVRIVDGGSDSLYALCRSWVRNGVPQEPQVESSL